MSPAEILINEMPDEDLRELSILACGYRIHHDGDLICAKLKLTDIKDAEFGEFNPLVNSDQCMLLIQRTAILTGVVSISVSSTRVMCEFMPEMMNRNSLAAMRRSIVKGCVKRWLDFHGLTRVMSMGDLHRRLKNRGFV